jgi:trans-aconitate methyltransferase
MNVIERATVLHFHRHRLRTFGAGTVEALGWRNEHSQQCRFEVIAGVGDFQDSTVLDVGCGTGDLKAFLDARFAGVRYLGVDQMPEFIEGARRRYADQPDTQFVLGSFDTLALPQADHVVASGAFGYRSADPHFIFNAIAQLYVAARRLLVFNVLDAKHFAEHPLLVGRDVDEIEAFCRRLAPDVEVIRGYAVDDATVVVRRQQVTNRSA